VCRILGNALTPARRSASPSQAIARCWHWRCALKWSKPRG